MFTTFIAIAGWIVIGWIVTALGALLIPSFRDELAEDEILLLTSVVVWPIMLLVGTFVVFIKYLNPAVLLKEIEKRRVSRQNVIVKPRPFRGKSD